MTQPPESSFGPSEGYRPPSPTGFDPNRGYQGLGARFDADAPQGPPPRKGGRALLAGIVAGVVVLLAGVAAVLFLPRGQQAAPPPAPLSPEQIAAGKVATEFATLWQAEARSAYANTKQDTFAPVSCPADVEALMKRLAAGPAPTLPQFEIAFRSVTVDGSKGTALFRGRLNAGGPVTENEVAMVKDKDGWRTCNVFQEPGSSAPVPTSPSPTAPPSSAPPISPSPSTATSEQR
ncbi:hypothetical protein D5S17_08920 [Pseudonocardiaceae bacterium YIM PH 21723]|nr:hypothetical protein D5S17_08920 [Pseudonocardiaceae bacterium YIM PH 21723]